MIRVNCRTIKTNKQKKNTKGLNKTCRIIEVVLYKIKWNNGIRKNNCCKIVLIIINIFIKCMLLITVKAVLQIFVRTCFSVFYLEVLRMVTELIQADGVMLSDAGASLGDPQMLGSSCCECFDIAVMNTPISVCMFGIRSLSPPRFFFFKDTLSTTSELLFTQLFCL